MVDLADFLDELLSALLEQANARDMRTGDRSGGHGSPVRLDSLKIPFVLAELLNGERPGQILFDALGGEGVMSFPNEDEAAARDHEVPGAELHGFFAALEDPTAGFDDLHRAGLEMPRDRRQ